jgi:hypothetical protein
MRSARQSAGACSDPAKRREKSIQPWDHPEHRKNLAAACPPLGSGDGIVPAQPSALVGQNPGSLLQHETLFDVRVGSFAAGSAEAACPQTSALHQYRPQILGLGICRDVPRAAVSRCRNACAEVNYSITSSANASNFGGNSTPIALAALRLSTNCSLVGCCTGRSPGFAPFKICPV